MIAVGKHIYIYIHIFHFKITNSDSGYAFVVILYLLYKVPDIDHLFSISSIQSLPISRFVVVRGRVGGGGPNINIGHISPTVMSWLCVFLFPDRDGQAGKVDGDSERVELVSLLCCICKLLQDGAVHQPSPATIGSSS